MSRCPSCGGTIGRDCFNPVECAWISNQQQEDHVRRLEYIASNNIPVSPLIEFSSSQLKLFIDVIEKAKDKCNYHFELGAADDLQLLEVQLHNALKIVMANEKIYQS